MAHLPGESPSPPWGLSTSELLLRMSPILPLYLGLSPSELLRRISPILHLYLLYLV